MVEGHEQTFQIFLQQELAERCRKNPRYSLRAFAKSLRISHTTLSRILHGRRGTTKRMRSRLAMALNMSPEEALNFEKPTKKYQYLTSDVFHLVADCYHDAILELPRVQNFQPDTKWISRALGVSINEVNAAVERLIRLGFISVGPSGAWTVHTPDTTNIMVGEYTTPAARKLQKQILTKAAEVIDEVSQDRRDNTSMTLAVDTRDIPMVRRMIKKFRRELTTYVERKSANPDEVFQMAVAFFPMTNLKEREQ